MLEWLAALCHPDGEIAFFNDAAIGIAPPPAELRRYAVRLGCAPPAEPGSGCRSLAESGYVRLQDLRAVALLDVARIGPDYMPGHAHADTLSFELSLDGRRVLVNSGTSLYADGPERLRQRATAAHNTVEIDGESSSEVWASFRVAWRARPLGLEMTQQGDACLIACGHDGYARLPGRPHHWRRWRFGNGKLVVSDRVEGAHGHAVAAFHFHPALGVATTADGASGTLSRGEETVLQWRVGRGIASVEPSTWHPEFGSSLPARRLLVTLLGGESVVAFSWARP